MRRRTFLRSGALALTAGAVGTATAGAADGYGPLGGVALPGAKELVVSEAGGTAFVAVTDGFATVDVTDPANPSVLAERRGLLADGEDGPLDQIFDVKREGDTLVVAGPANGTRGFLGFVVYDVADPSAPTERLVYEAGTSIHNCDVHDGHVYLTGNAYVDKPMVVVDVTGDSATEVARWSLLDHDDAWRDLPSWSYTLHDLYVEDGTAYLAYWDAGTWIVDVSEPASPGYVGHLGDYTPADLVDLSRQESRVEYVEPEGNAHYVTVDDDATLLATGGESWDDVPGDGHGGPSGIDLWDVADPSSPSKLASIEPATVEDGTQATGVWTTAHNFELHGDRLYSAWYHDGVRLFDVSDPASPTELAHWRRPAEHRFWTAQVGRPGEFFVASDMGADFEGQAGVFTFPDAAGDQDAMPPLERTPTASPPPTTGPTLTDSPSATGTPATPTPYDLARSDSPSGTPATSPGFGVGAALGGLALGGLRLLQRRRSE